MDELLEQASYLVTKRPYNLPIDARITIARLIYRINPLFANNRTQEFIQETQQLLASINPKE
jgi:hypothetical protein